tara:strand:- start:358 stop:789 length:432 start_codon:yes stop_codon:yes gene_type:complete
MKTVSIRLTDKQHHYLSSLAKSERRSIEHLLWMFIPAGVDCQFAEQNYYLEKLQCDFTEEDKAHMKEFPLNKPSWGNEYYGTHHWSDEIQENVLADIEGTFVAADAAFDLQAAIQATAALHAQRAKDHQVKQAAAEKQQEKSK